MSNVGSRLRDLPSFAVALILPSLALTALSACNGQSLKKGINATVGSTTAHAATTPTAGAQLDIVDTAVASGKFSTLAAALKATNLIGTLKGPGPFTVFAPTDDAFAKLPAGTLDSLVANPEALKSILLLHVAKGTFTADRIFLRKEVKTLGGVAGCRYSDRCGLRGVLTLAPFLNDRAGERVSVVAEDVKASNGIIQVIDGVLLNPPTSCPTGGVC